MATDFSELDEPTLKKMLEDATDYESRSKIRAAIRELKKKTGQPLGRNRANTSQYRRPGFQAPRTVTIPNSVTGNVYPSVVKDGETTKKPDKNTPTIGYLNSQATPSKSSRKSSTDASPSHVSSTANNLVPKEGQEDNWWRKSRSSSQSTGTPAETPEPKGVDDRRPSANEAIPENLDTDERGYLSPDPPKEPSPSPEPPKDPTPSPEPPKEPTPSPEPPKEPTPSPEPPKEPTPSPEPPKEPTPSPEPPKEPTPSPEPVPREVRESTPSPEITPSPEPPKEPTPSPELDEQRKYSSDDAEYERDHYEEDDADEELRQLEERYPEPSEKKLNEGAGKDAFSNTEPGLEEDKDFRKKLRRTENSKIDTKAAFPSTKGKAEQVDFRNLLKKSDGPGKKDIKSGSKAQVDFRANLKSKDSDGRSPVRSPVQSPVHPPLTEEPPISTSPVVTKQPSVDNEDTKPAETNESSEESKPPPEDSYEARREARRRERELRRKQEEEAKPTSSTSDSTTATATTSAAEDSYEARREARRKAREERMKNIAESEPKMSYRERKEKEEAKRRQEMSANKQKWAEMDQANGGSTERSFTRQKSSSGQQQLLAWCQHKTRYFENVDVKDFSNSWKDGLALCAILHNFVPDLIPYDDLTPDNPRKNYTIALKAAEDAGLERFFDVDDIIAAGSPDPKSMMTFLATIYTHFK